MAAGLLFSTGGAAIKAASLTGWQVASFRSGLAAVVLLAALPNARRRWHWRMLPVAAAYAATLILFVLANRLTTSANAIFLQATAPLYVLLLGPFCCTNPSGAPICSTFSPWAPVWRSSSPAAIPWPPPRPTRRAATCWPWPAA